MDVVHDAVVLIVEGRDLLDHLIDFLFSLVTLAVQLVQLLGQTGDLILHIPTTESLRNDLFGSTKSVIDFFPLLGNFANESVDFVHLLVQGIQIASNRTEFVKFVIQSSDFVAKTLDLVIELSDGGSGVLQVLGLAFKHVLEVAQPVAEIVQSVVNVASVRSKLITIMDEIFTLFEDLVKKFFKAFGVIQKRFDGVQSFGIFGSLVQGLDFFFNSVEAIVGVSYIIIEISQLGKNVLNGLASFGNDEVELIPTLFHHSKIFFDVIFVNVTSINESVARKGGAVEFGIMTVNVITESLEFFLLFLQFSLDEGNGGHLGQGGFGLVQPGHELGAVADVLLARLHGGVEPLVPVHGRLLDLLPLLFNVSKSTFNVFGITLLGPLADVFASVDEHDDLVLLTHDLLVKGLEFLALMLESVLVGRNGKFVSQKRLKVSEHVLDVVASIGKVTAFAICVFKLGQSIVQLLATVVELTFDLSKGGFDFVFGGRIGKDVLKLATQTGAIGQRWPLVIQIAGNALQSSHFPFDILFRGSNVIQIIRDLAQVIPELVGQVQEVASGSGKVIEGTFAFVESSQKVIPFAIGIIKFAFDLTRIRSVAGVLQKEVADFVEPVPSWHLLIEILSHDGNLAHLVLNQPGV